MMDPTEMISSKYLSVLRFSVPSYNNIMKYIVICSKFKLKQNISDKWNLFYYNRYNSMFLIQVYVENRLSLPPVL